MPKKPLLLTDAAESSLLEIGFYTERTWGKKQRIVYMSAIHEALQKLPQYPEKGHIRNELRDGLRCIHVQKHSIFYLIRPNDILVIDILHQQMDPILHLNVEH